MLRIHDVAIELVGEVMAVLEAIERRDPDLARQGRRAIASVPLNIAEGSDQSGRRREQHYRIALGSARESWSVIKTAQGMRIIGPPSDYLTNRFDIVIGTLHKCIYGRTVRKAS